ncbi:ABC transporter ATP-binding protein [Corynebacterium terpenotabidum]|uniref:ABC transporter-related protein n=1 Tax=Corynebacterium terpenotabidum Y-11 TaxID=1200352 RepID=S4XLM2_9CORY|nr:ATP-binding cassette domain-containing protein [Corynebacterium terpenotabidum]AGP31463.1 ABC transporter-related protein [Corynebacterium terpenotabidum Y-11]
MTTPLLELKNVSIAAVADDGSEKTICHDVNLTLNEGERHILLGPNGSGKSTLLAGIMGLHPFRITAGTATLRGEDITDLETEERAHAGIGLAFQRPPALAGVSVERLAAAIGASDRLDAVSESLGLDHLDDRDVNCGFSGGEAKRFEVMKLALQGPQLCLFDEPESGVDLEQVGVVGRAVSELLDAKDAEGRHRSALVITHTGFILDSLDATVAHLMVDGTIVSSGEPRAMFDHIRTNGYR